MPQIAREPMTVHFHPVFLVQIENDISQLPQPLTSTGIY